MNSVTVIQSLQTLKTEGNPVTTVYLDVSTSQKLRNADIVVNNMFKQKKDKTFYKNLSDQEKMSVEKDVEGIIKFLKNQLGEERRSLMMISSNRAYVWRVIHLGFPVENMMVIQDRPYLRPFLEGISHERNYAIVLVDQGKAKILMNHLGNKEELFNVVNLLPEDANEGGFGGMEERKNERHREEVVAKHFKNVAAQLDTLDQKYHFDWILLGGLRESMSDFANYLKSGLKDKIAREIPVDPNLSMDKVFQLVDKEIPGCRIDFEKDILNMFANEFHKNHKGVAGIHQTEEALQQGRVDMLMIQEGFQTKGRVCKWCLYMTTEEEDVCPNCGHPMERTLDITDELIHMALDTGAKIEFISSEMGEFSPVCGLLRY
ncbi:MAG: peptide chain release factor subunit 1 [Candidatus Marinimicrobia bacterium]|nr:peptide chain release factor subunit 1 [Candidatus Neomarinimicrobiota bacterium]